MGKKAKSGADLAWSVRFELVKQGSTEALPFIMETEDKEQLAQIAAFLQEEAKKEQSANPTEHFDGYLARVNLQYCRQKIRKKEQA